MRSIRNYLAIAVLSLFTTSAFALERSAESVDPEDSSDWFAGTTCSVVYYNFCTGWVFNWSGWEDGDVIGNVVPSCCPSGGELVGSNLRIREGAPSGYGFTGSISVYAADANDCPTGAPIASQPFLPTSGWQPVIWGVNVPSRYIVTVTHAGVAPTRHRTDHPSPGPTGPEACGTCYPTNRETRSFYYGTASSPLCPGSPFDDAESICNAELMWEHAMTCPVSIDDTTFGKVKSLYR